MRSDKMGVKPKADNPDDLKAWMSDFVSSNTNVKPTVRVKQEERVITSFPKVSFFSGDSKVKGETSFDLWHYEVDCLMKSGLYSSESVVQAARKSLKGEASRIAMRLGPNANIELLMSKLEGIFGVVETGEDILALFYSSTQRDNEDVAAWSCRIEDLLDKARVQGYVRESDMGEMLRNRLWKGLNEALKDRTAYMFDRIQDYDDLRVSLRRTEHDKKLSPELVTEKCQVNMSVTKSEHSAVVTDNYVLNNITKTLEELKKEFYSWKHGGQCSNVANTTINSDHVQTNAANNVHSLPGQFRGRGQGHIGQGHIGHRSQDHRGQGHYRGHNSTDAGNHVQSRAANNHYISDSGETKNQFSFPSQGQYQLPCNQAPSSYNMSGQSNSVEPQCYRCGQMGQLQYGCRVILNRSVNYGRSTTLGSM